MGPETCAKKFWAIMESNHYSLERGYRYGWFTMDFPKDWFIK